MEFCPNLLLVELDHVQSRLISQQSQNQQLYLSKVSLFEQSSVAKHNRLN